eukprot:2199434-Karenia_brevis.AAC.2
MDTDAQYDQQINCMHYRSTQDKNAFRPAMCSLCSGIDTFNNIERHIRHAHGGDASVVQMFHLL